MIETLRFSMIVSSMDEENTNHISQYYHEGYCPHKKGLHIRTVIPADWGTRLSHVVVDLGIGKGEALREAVAMFLRFHGRAEGIPEPLLPVSAREEASR